MILGMQHQLKFGKLTTHLRFRGAFGHYLSSDYRLIYELRDNIKYYNVVNTRYFSLKSNSRNVFSERLVEKGSYLQLDQMFFSYDFSSPSSSIFRDFRLFFGGNNLFTFSGFTGIDPEVRYQEIQYQADGSMTEHQAQFNTLAGGFEILNTYPIVRSWFVGLEIIF